MLECFSVIKVVLIKINALVGFLCKIVQVRCMAVITFRNCSIRTSRKQQTPEDATAFYCCVIFLSLCIHTNSSFRCLDLQYLAGSIFKPVAVPCFNDGAPHPSLTHPSPSPLRLNANTKLPKSQHILHFDYILQTQLP